MEARKQDKFEARRQNCSFATLRRSNEEIGCFLASPSGRANFDQLLCCSSLEYHQGTLRSSRRESVQNSRRQIDGICELLDFCSLFLRLLRCFTSAGMHRTDKQYDYCGLRSKVSPFGNSRIIGCYAPPRDVSPLRCVLHRLLMSRHPPFALGPFCAGPTSHPNADFVSP